MDRLKDGNRPRLIAMAALLLGLALVVPAVLAQEPQGEPATTETVTTESTSCCQGPRGGERMGCCQQAEPEACCQGMAAGRGMGRGNPSGAGGCCAGMGRGPAADEATGRGMMGRGMGGGNHQVMQKAMTLVHNRFAIEREVEEIAGGVRTTTRVKDDPEVLAVLRAHVGDVEQLLQSGGRIRQWDPLFAAIFDHYDEIEMTIEELPDGVRVTETSENPAVAELIRAHAAKVNDFLARGHDAVHEATPLPEGYRSGDGR